MMDRNILTVAVVIGLLPMFGTTAEWKWIDQSFLWGYIVSTAVVVIIRRVVGLFCVADNPLESVIIDVDRFYKLVR